jgi:hypothetical protein
LQYRTEQVRSIYLQGVLVSDRTRWPAFGARAVHALR